LEPTHEQPPQHCTVQLKAICVCTLDIGRARSSKLIDICAVVQPNLSVLVKKPQHLHAVSDSRRYTPVVPAADVREVTRFHTYVFAVVQPDPPAIVASRFSTANDTLPAVEVRGAEETCQANIEFKVQTIKYHVSDFDIKGVRWVRYRALQCGVAMHG
jgi:hypothetical protein